MMQPVLTEKKQQPYQPQHRLYRSSTDRMLGGVCGGLGKYLEIDPLLIRLVFVLLAFSGVSIVLYILLWLLIPNEPQAALQGQMPDQPLDQPLDQMSGEAQAQSGSQFASSETIRTGADEIAERARALANEVGLNNHDSRDGNRKIAVLAGVALVFWGLVALVRTLHIPWLWWFNWDVFWPVLLICAGAILIWRRTHRLS